MKNTTEFSEKPFSKALMIPSEDIAAAEQKRRTVIDEKAMKRIASEALRQVDGILGFEGNLADVIKSGGHDDLLGLAVDIADDGKVSVAAKIITEYGKNIPQIVSYAKIHLAQAVESLSGLTLDNFEVEVADTMTRDEYRAKNTKAH